MCARHLKFLKQRNVGKANKFLARGCSIGEQLRATNTNEPSLISRLRKFPFRKRSLPYLKDLENCRTDIEISRPYVPPGAQKIGNRY